MTVYKIAERVTVNAPAARVWQALTAWDRQSDWVIATQTYATELAGQGVGGGLSAYTGFGPLRFKDTMVITEWQPPTICRVRHTGRVVRGTGTFEVQPTGERTAAVIWSENLQLPGGRLAEMSWPAIHLVSSWLLRRSLRRFADWAPAYPL
ncbi:MAG: SRPBCC family protein [Mycobacteriales bacterium]